jgi:hypothetical protein
MDVSLSKAGKDQIFEIEKVIGRAMIKNKASSIDPKKLINSEWAGVKPFFMNSPILIYPPPTAVGVIAEPSSVASAIWNDSTIFRGFLK